MLHACYTKEPYSQRTGWTHTGDCRGPQAALRSEVRVLPLRDSTHPVLLRGPWSLGADTQRAAVNVTETAWARGAAKSHRPTLLQKGTTMKYFIPFIKSF